MNLDKYFGESLETKLSKFRLSDHISRNKYEQKQILESPINENIIGDSKIEQYTEQYQELFDGYLGEQKDIPNPLEYGPNATYRNLREGVVYKKGPDNLWETFIKDGQPGKQGAAGGSGTGVNEVKQIVNNALSNIISGDRVLLSNSSKNIIESNITTTQINYLSGTSASIQSQINNKAETSQIIPTHKLIREIYYSPHVGTSSLTTKNILTQFSSYTITSADAQIWLNYRKILRDEFMFGVRWENVDNMVNFICTWNGVTVVDNVYARPNITGGQTFTSGQNRVLDFVNDFRIQGYSGNIVNPRNHAKWSTNYGGTVDFGSSEEYSYGQNAVDITNGINVVWSYYINGTDSTTVYFDNHRVIL